MRLDGGDADHFLEGGLSPHGLGQGVVAHRAHAGAARGGSERALVGACQQRLADGVGDREHLEDSESAAEPRVAAQVATATAHGGGVGQVLLAKPEQVQHPGLGPVGGDALGAGTPHQPLGDDHGQ